ncbi:MAG: type I phosphomannose isomerase catalytic subunit [Terracidiphilus sp.]
MHRKLYTAHASLDNRLGACSYLDRASVLLEWDLPARSPAKGDRQCVHEMARFGLFRKAAASPKPFTEDSVFAALSPFRIEPRFVSRVWGTRDLHPWYDWPSENANGAQTEGSSEIIGDSIGEVWLTGDDCRVATGPHTGKSLADLFKAEPDALLGKGVPSTDSPLLIKVIFAREKLSVQVHPDDQLAQKYGQPRGKTECWYALAAEPGAEVAAGLRAGVTQDQVRSGIHDGTLENSLQVLPIAAGDMVLVDAGTVHAIWPGSVLLETQQNCDLTYRLYDYGRPRELHVEKGLEATRLVTRAGKVQPRVLRDRIILLDEAYFCVERIPFTTSRSSTTLSGPGESTPGLSYLFAAAGSGRLTSPSFSPIDLPPRGIIAVPASSPIFAVLDLGGLDLIRISPRWPR